MFKEKNCRLNWFSCSKKINAFTKKSKNNDIVYHCGFHININMMIKLQKNFIFLIINIIFYVYINKIKLSFIEIKVKNKTVLNIQLYKWTEILLLNI